MGSFPSSLFTAESAEGIAKSVFFKNISAISVPSVVNGFWFWLRCVAFSAVKIFRGYIFEKRSKVR
jgi:hypothetical protein